MPAGVTREGLEREARRHGDRERTRSAPASTPVAHGDATGGRRTALVIAVPLLILFGLVLSKSLAAYLATASPRAALWLNSSQPTALVRLAEQRLAELRSRRASSVAPEPTAPSGGDAARAEAQAALESDIAALAEKQRLREIGARAYASPKGTGAASPPQVPLDADTEAALVAEIRALCERAIVAAPLDPRGFRILAGLAAEAGETKRATEFYAAAAARSRHEPEAYYRLMVTALDAGDFAKVVEHADTLLRTTPGAITTVAPVLAGLAEMNDAARLVEAALAADPPWRASFFASAPAHIRDARTPLKLLLALKGTPNSPTKAELRGYLDFLVARNYHELAYYTWLQFLATEDLAKAGLLFNADFQLTPSGLPFDWVFKSGAGVTIEILPHPDTDGLRALSVDFGGGRVDFGGVQQWVVLSPGRYVLQGRYKGDLSGRRGLKWRVRCATGPAAALGESAMMLGRQPAWREFSVAFTVPEQDCAAQIVRLDLDARSTSETLVSGTLWYDALNMSRGTDEPPPVAPAQPAK